MDSHCGGCLSCTSCVTGLGESEWDQIDSCWGFYGSDWKTNGIKEHLSPHECDVVVEE